MAEESSQPALVTGGVAGRVVRHSGGGEAWRLTRGGLRSRFVVSRDRHSSRSASDVRASADVDVAAPPASAQTSALLTPGVWMVAIAAGAAASASTVAKPAVQDRMRVLTVVISSSKKCATGADANVVLTPKKADVVFGV